jgi:hypothetical protein
MFCLTIFIKIKTKEIGGVGVQKNGLQTSAISATTYQVEH